MVAQKLQNVPKTTKAYKYSLIQQSQMCITVSKCSAVAEMGDHLAIIDMGQRVRGCCAPFLGRRSWVPI